MIRRPRLRRYPGPGSISAVLDVQVAANADDGFIWDTSYSDASVYQAVGDTGGGFSYDNWQRFLNVTIPGGATIDVAYITVTGSVSSKDGAGVKTKLMGDDIDNAISPVDRAEYLALAETTAKVDWDDADIPQDVEADSPDISAIIQEIVDRGGWSSGNALQILHKDDASDADKRLINRSHNADPAKAPKLHVEYTT